MATVLAGQQCIAAESSVDRTQISSASGILLSAYLNDGLAAPNTLRSKIPEDTNVKKDKEQAERLRERGCEVAQGSF